MSITVDGTNGITVPKVTSAGLVDISGAAAGQIKFPAAQNASADANTLDDYEEGTWTPTIKFGSGNTGVTYSGQYGTYTKVGRVVTFTCYLLLATKGSSTGALNINGLPFTSIGGNMFYNYAVRPQACASLSGGCVAYLGTSDNILYVNQTVTGSTIDVTDTNLTNGSSFIISGSYFTS